MDDGERMDGHAEKWTELETDVYGGMNVWTDIKMN